MLETNKIVPLITSSTIIFLLMFATVLPTEQRWSEADMYVAIVTVGVAFYGTVFSILECRRITVVDVIVSAWILYYIGRVWLGNEFSCRTEFLKATEMALLYFSLRLSIDRVRVPNAYLIAIVMAGGCYEALYGAWQMIEGDSRLPEFAVTGNFQNPGPYSAYLMLGLIVGINASLSYKGKKLNEAFGGNLPVKVSVCLKSITVNQIIFSAMIPICMVLPATWSRAAYFCIVMMLLWIFKECYWRYRHIVWGIMILAGLGLYIIKQGSADGRIIIWCSSIMTWLDCPWFGVGIGGYRNAFAEGMSSLYEHNVNVYSAGVTDYTYNILVKILVEQGIVGGLMASILCACVLKTLYKTSMSLLYGMLSLLLFSMFSYPFELLPYKIIVVIIVAWSESINGRTICKLGRIKTILFSGLLVFSAWETYKLMDESYKADRNYTKIRGFHDKAFIRSYYELLPLEEDNATFLFDFGKDLREQKRYNDSNDVLEKGIGCSADPMFYVLMGNNYRDMAQLELAEVAYRKAFSIMPNRLYPLYQLMMMYRNNGEMRKAKDVARRVMALKPKVESSATRDMKDCAVSIMNM